MCFFIGLSYIPNNNRSLSQSQQHNEGRRILSLLEKQAGTSLAAISIEPSGRPYFTDHHADFSISHSQSMIAVSTSTAINPKNGLPFRTGIDVQHINPKTPYHSIIKRYFSPDERNYINSTQADFEAIRRFFQIWTLKECFIKLNSLSISNIKDTPSFIIQGTDSSFTIPNQFFHHDLTFFLYEYGNKPEVYMLAVAIEASKDKRPEPIWFSTNTVPYFKHISE